MTFKPTFSSINIPGLKRVSNFAVSPEQVAAMRQKMLAQPTAAASSSVPGWVWPAALVAVVAGYIVFWRK
jgi:hypothetical protein